MLQPSRSSAPDCSVFPSRAPFAFMMAKGSAPAMAKWDTKMRRRPWMRIYGTPARSQAPVKPSENPLPKGQAAP